MGERQLISPPYNLHEDFITRSDLEQLIPVIVSAVSSTVISSLSETSGDLGGSGQSRPAEVVHADRPLVPFTIYADRKDSEQGLKLYLPAGSVVIDGEVVDIKFSETLTTGKWYLHVDTNKKSAAVSNAEHLPGYNQHLLIAEIDTSSEWCGTYVKSQCLSGAVVLGTTVTPGCFDLVYNEQGMISGVLCPYVMCGREVVIASGVPTDGVNVVRVQHEYDFVTASIESGSAIPKNPSNTYTDIPLYKIKDNKIVEDYRNMPRVPLYDPRVS